MKVRMEIAEDLPEDEILIRCGRVDENIRNIYRYLLEQAKSGPKIAFFKENREYYGTSDLIRAIQKRRDLVKLNHQDTGGAEK